MDTNASVLPVLKKGVSTVLFSIKVSNSIANLGSHDILSREVRNHDCILEIRITLLPVLLFFCSFISLMVFFWLLLCKCLSCMQLKNKSISFFVFFQIWRRMTPMWPIKCNTWTRPLRTRCLGSSQSFCLLSLRTSVDIVSSSMGGMTYPGKVGLSVFLFVQACSWSLFSFNSFIILVK